jgi:hypothetical protein
MQFVERGQNVPRQRLSEDGDSPEGGGSGPSSQGCEWAEPAVGRPALVRAAQAALLAEEEPERGPGPEVGGSRIDAGEGGESGHGGLLGRWGGRRLATPIRGTAALPFVSAESMVSLQATQLHQHFPLTSQTLVLRALELG